MPFNLKRAAAHGAPPAEERLAFAGGRHGAEIRRGIRQADGGAGGLREFQAGGLHLRGLVICDEADAERGAGGGGAESGELRGAVGDFRLQFAAERGDAVVAGAGGGGVRAQIFEPDDLLSVFFRQRIGGGDEPFAHGDLFEMGFIPEIELVMLHKRFGRQGAGEKACAGSSFNQKTRFFGQNTKKNHHRVKRLRF